jgi:hypothetical protein
MDSAVPVFPYSCVRGFPSISQISPTLAPIVVQPKTTHYATTEEVHEERSHRNRPRRTPSWRRQRNLSRSGTFARVEKLEALQKARVEKTAHILEQYTQQDAHENEDDEDEDVDRELKEVQ